MQAVDLKQEDIHAYLARHQKKELLRFLTCGSVDDGKSTLIGRLLHDTKMIYEDQLAAVKRDSEKVGTTGAGEIDLALLTDGLKAEREQGITIDVAYRYFSTDRRKFIIADTPGHEQYTRNMATGASTANVAIILVDARKGVLPQTRRHSYIVSMLGVRDIVLAVNKMDLVDFSRATFERLVADDGVGQHAHMFGKRADQIVGRHDAHQLRLGADDGYAANAALAHHFHHVQQFMVAATGGDGAGHDFRHRHGTEILVGNDGPHRQVAVRHDTDRLAFAVAHDDERADVFALHPLRGFAYRRVRLDAYDTV